MAVDGQTRRRLRGDYEVAVRVACDRCGRTLGHLYGTATDPAEFATPAASGPLVPATRVDHFAHTGGRCRAAPLARYDRLVAAYRRAAAKPDGRRVIWLPADLRSS
jgi:hypothetical protein